VTELDQIAERYARRGGNGDRYSLLRPEVWQMWQERQRALLRLLAMRPGVPADWRATEVGCGPSDRHRAVARTLGRRARGAA
jgi:hypothetical protein